jgi:putative ABC transport system permease protein
MFRNYLKIALRQMRTHKFYSAIKIGGFALGIATCLLIGLYIRNEISYDRDWANTGRLFRVIQVWNPDGKESKGPAMPAPFAVAFKREFPEVELAGRIMPYPLFGGAGSNEVRADGTGENIFEEGFSYADQSMLDMFSFPMVYGDRAHALAEPQTIVISQRKADKYFPGQDPVGKLLYLNDDKAHPWKIGGVMKDMPANSHLQYDWLLSLAGHELWPGEQQMWLADNYDTYVLLRGGADVAALQKKMKVMFGQHILPGLLAMGTKDPQHIINSCSFLLQPVRDIHLRSYGISDSETHGDIRLVWLFAAVGCFILLLACINFVNLSTARSAGRAKEVGLRKVVGSRRGGLVWQFLLESLVMSGFAFLLALVLAWVLMPWFNQLTATSLRMPWTEWWLMPVLAGAAIFVGVLAGIYPAVYLSGFRPVEVLKGRVAAGGRGMGAGWRGLLRGTSLRSVLVVFQFTTSAILIIATFVVYRQMRFIMDRKMGYDKSQVMLVQGTGVLDKQLPAFKTELLKLPGVTRVSVSDFLPVSGGKRNLNSFWKAGREKLDPRIAAQSWWVDQDYIPAMGMTIVKGRNFSDQMASDTTAVVINETMARQLGVADPIGMLISNGGPVGMHVVGVVRDFNFESVTDEIGPLVLHRGNWATVVAVKMDTRDLAGLIKRVGGVWKGFLPHQEIRYTFMDDSFAHMYADVQRTGDIFTSLATLAVIIACLGLLALSAFMAEQRRREIGIRKVLGATVMQLAGLMSGEFVKLVLIAVVIAAPVAWWGMHVWLQNYVYRIEIGPGVFVAAGVLVLAIAVVTISWQAMKAAMANPAGSLRAE